MFKCEECSKILSTRGSLKSHIVEAHEGVRHECDFCEKSYLKKSDLKSHVNGIHKGMRYKCILCVKLFITPQLVSGHLRKYHGFSGRLAPGSIKPCFPDESTVQETFTCDICDKCFGDNIGLIKHHQNAHLQLTEKIDQNVKASRKTFSCDLCNKPFNSEKRLKTHQGKKHRLQQNAKLLRPSKKEKVASIKKFTCDVCDKSFRSEKRLNLHRGTMHDFPKESKMGNFKCHVCGMSFKEKFLAKAHFAEVHQRSSKRKVLKIKLKQPQRGRRRRKPENSKLHSMEENLYFNDEMNLDDSTMLSLDFGDIEDLIEFDEKILDEIIFSHGTLPYWCTKCDGQFNVKEDLEMHNEMSHPN